MAKILDVNVLIPEVEVVRKGKTVGLITGCFDLLHVGHVDILIVGIENDLSIQKSKGITRPIISQQQRAEMLGEFISIDYVTILDNPHEFKSELTNIYHNELIVRVRPHYVITNKKVDKYWKEKEKKSESS